jgi:anthranilate phosphoribosyltransferase
MFAPRHHPAMRHVAPIRKELGIRTIFNLLGPLTNPANVKRHLIGVYELEWLGPMAEVLQKLGSKMAWLVHGHDDMDEITTTNSTDIVEMKDQYVRHFTISPEQFDIPRIHINEIFGGDAKHNATELRRLLRGLRSAYRDIVIMNAGAALHVAGKTEDMRHGMRLAATALDTGAAYDTLDKIIRISNRSFL